MTRKRRRGGKKKAAVPHTHARSLIRLEAARRQGTRSHGRASAARCTATATTTPATASTAATATATTTVAADSTKHTHEGCDGLQGVGAAAATTTATTTTATTRLEIRTFVRHLAQRITHDNNNGTEEGMRGGRESTSCGGTQYDQHAIRRRRRRR